MYKSIFRHFVLMLSVSIFSCAGKNQSEELDDGSFKVCKVVILSPYGCYQEIELTGKGDGVLKSGLRGGSMADKYMRLDTLFSTDSFHILSKQDLIDIHRIAQSILDSADIRGGPKDDAYRLILYIDGANKIDIYGLSKNLHELLSYMINYLPISNDRCEFFELFKKSILSSQ